MLEILADYEFKNSLMYAALAGLSASCLVVQFVYNVRNLNLQAADLKRALLEIEKLEAELAHIRKAKQENAPNVDQLIIDSEARANRAGFNALVEPMSRTRRAKRFSIATAVIGILSLLMSMIGLFRINDRLSLGREEVEVQFAASKELNTQLIGDQLASFDWQIQHACQLTSDGMTAPAIYAGNAFGPDLLTNAIRVLTDFSGTGINSDGTRFEITQRTTSQGVRFEITQRTTSQPFLEFEHLGSPE